MSFQLDPKEESRARLEGRREADREAKTGRETSRWETGDQPRKRSAVLSDSSGVVFATGSDES
jgi:hypothetical protein